VPDPVLIAEKPEVELAQALRVAQRLWRRSCPRITRPGLASRRDRVQRPLSDQGLELVQRLFRGWLISQAFYSRGGNRQLNYALHNDGARPDAPRCRHQSLRGPAGLEGKSDKEAMRCLKRHCPNVVFRQLIHDVTNLPKAGLTIQSVSLIRARAPLVVRGWPWTGGVAH
jgi:hypothetical protein